MIELIGGALITGLTVMGIGHAFGWKWFVQVVIALDQMLNAILAGNADETLSARSWRMSDAVRPKHRWSIARKMIDGLFFWDADHCYNAWQSEVTRQHMRGAY